MAESTSRILEVAAASRLHFGLLSFGAAGREPLHVDESLRDSTSRLGETRPREAGEPRPRDLPADDRRFGGAGVMIERPGLLLRFSPADRLSAAGPLAHRAFDFARHFAACQHVRDEPHCRIEIVRAPREHVGLGVGTSLGISVAAGLAAWLGLEAMSAEQLAASVGRGRRSAVGAHGFLHGGLIAEAGKSSGEAVSPLLERVELPPAWRFVLLCPAGAGLSGGPEEQAFRALPAMPASATQALRDELLTELLPAARRGDFPAFSESLYRFNRAAGECYAPYQDGPYAGPRLGELVAAIRAAGVRGVGQSSWGPTLFALFPDQAAAEQFVGASSKPWGGEGIESTIAPVRGAGATITWRE